MKRALSLVAVLAFAGVSLAGDCGSAVASDGCGRQGLLARRAERRAARSSCGCEPATATLETVQPAEIRTQTIYKTTKVGERVTIVPTGSTQTVQPSTTKKGTK